MIDTRKLRELVKLMVENDLAEVDIRDSEEQVSIVRRHPDQSPAVVTSSNSLSSTPVLSEKPIVNDVPAVSTEDNTENTIEIVSPMVGTFYAQPSPDASPFVGIGDRIQEDSVVCIIEAMKIFNEIKAECEGTVVEILVKSGESIEFGQPIYRVKPS